MGTERMAFLDAKMINDIYCPNACEGFDRNLRCQAGGYPDPNNCNVCKCPDALGGVECERLQPSICGGELIATDQWQTLRSPELHDTRASNQQTNLNPSFNKNVQCYWRISAPEGSHIRFRLSDGENSNTGTIWKKQKILDIQSNAKMWNLDKSGCVGETI
uniref:CUB domain-containing protein n=1 Tax=Meloidogyne hapla TaxID=6305 RepID=A0A1I8B6D3_MELHA